MSLDALILKLFEIQAIRFGSFTLKSGITSPFYLDLRLTISYPHLLVAIAEALHVPMRSLHFTLLCGVPYTALPFATALCIQHTLPMVMRRKEKKEYGTARLLEGVYHKGERCLIIEDVITSGTSILETAETLRSEGLIVEDAVVLVDREQGGAKALRQHNLRVHSILTISTIMETLIQKGKIEKTIADEVQTFVQSHQLC